MFSVYAEKHMALMERLYLFLKEVKDMQKHLQNLFTGNVQMGFAEKIACRNKEH